MPRERVDLEQSLEQLMELTEKITTLQERMTALGDRPDATSLLTEKEKLEKKRDSLKRHILAISRLQETQIQKLLDFINPRSFFIRLKTAYLILIGHVPRHEA